MTKTNKYETNKVMFEYFDSRYSFKEDYCFITITCNGIIEGDKQLRELERIMLIFPFPFVASLEWSLEKANGYHLHMIMSKLNLFLVEVNCNYHIPFVKKDHSFHKALNYLCKEFKYGKSIKSYYQKNKGELFRISKGNGRNDFIQICKEEEKIRGYNLDIKEKPISLKSGSGKLKYVNSILKWIKKGFSKLFIKTSQILKQSNYDSKWKNNCFNGRVDNPP